MFGIRLEYTPWWRCPLADGDRPPLVSFIVDRGSPRPDYWHGEGFWRSVPLPLWSPIEDLSLEW